MLFILTLAFLGDLSWALPKDIVIQFERSVLANGTVVERIHVNGASIYLNGEVDDHPFGRPIKDEVLRMMVDNNHATASNVTYKRLRECKLKGYQVLGLSDRFQLNGRDYLILDWKTDSWTVLVPEASDLKQTWTRENTRSVSQEKDLLKEECEELMKQMNDNQKIEGHGALRVMGAVLAIFLFIGFVIINLLIFKRHGQHPGGVLGSIIHYPAHFLEVPPEGKSQKSISQVPSMG